MNISAFRLIAAPHTPFHADGRLNGEAVARQAAHLARCGVDGVFVGGTTGESASLTVEERISLAERWCQAAPACDLDVLVHVGHTSQSDACRLAAHAQQAHADAVAAYAPHYFKPSAVDDLIDFLAPIAQAAGDLPFYYYDIPVMTGVRLPMVEFLERGKARIPNLVGLKYSNDDLVQLLQCIQFQEGEFEILFGRDEALIAAMACGVRGAVGSTYNFAAPLYRRLLGAVAAGDWPAARALQAQSIAIVRAMESFGFLAASKAAMSLLGVDCGPPRPPLRKLPAEQIEALRGRLEQIGFFDRAAAPAPAASPAPAAPPSQV
mgnify:CR=1 FL=1